MGLITLMGSGEISPTMVKVHRAILERYEAPRCVFVDTPFGFQANADEITTKVIDYFSTSLNTEVEVASMRSAANSSGASIERMLEQVRSADYLFSGPGSPSYALRNWAQVGFGDAVASVLSSGGSVTLASAAAVTAGTNSVPVYEIYKVGEEPFWVKGLDVLRAIGIGSTVIPHYDNAEGGTHDTRYCYLGQDRFDFLRSQLDEDIVVVGVDEHTALMFDTSERTAEVIGRGSAHFLRGSFYRGLPAGSKVALADCLPPNTWQGPSVEPPTPIERMDFDAAIANGDAAGAVEAALRSEGSAGSDRAALRGMISRLGDAAETGLADPRAVVGGYIEALLELRDRARLQQQWAEADFIRDKLTELSVTVTDTETGTEWELV